MPRSAQLSLRSATHVLAVAMMFIALVSVPLKALELPALVGGGQMHLRVNVQGSPLLSLVFGSLHARGQASAPLATWPPGRTQVPDVVSWAEQQLHDAVSVVLVEPWDGAESPTLRAWIAANLESGTAAQAGRFGVRMTAPPSRAQSLPVNYACYAIWLATVRL